MHKSVFLQVALVLATFLLFGNFGEAQIGSGGSKRKNDLFTGRLCPVPAGFIPVRSAADLQGMGEDLGASYFLCKDIDFEGKSWTALGDLFNPFTGILEGNGKTIRNLSLSSEWGSAGIFMRSQGTIRNLSLDNIYFDVFQGGCIADWTDEDSLIQNVHVTNAYLVGVGDLGGLVNLNGGTISNCSFNGTIENKPLGCCSWGTTFGGIAADSYGFIEDCNSSGLIDVSTNTVGGIAGSHGRQYSNNIAWIPIMARCWSSMDINAGSGSAGGLVGFNVSPWDEPATEHSIIEQCYATGNVRSYTGGAGGLVGGNRGLIRDCYANGDVACFYVDSGGQTNGGFAGGLVGTNQRTIENSYSIGMVGPAPERNGDIGGLVGEEEMSGGDIVPIVVSSFFDSDRAGTTSSVGGEPKTTLEMQSLLTFLNWDISFLQDGVTSIWEIAEGLGYPELFFNISNP